jgi:hypothetical protein
MFVALSAQTTVDYKALLGQKLDELGHCNKQLGEAQLLQSRFVKGEVADVGVVYEAAIKALESLYAKANPGEKLDARTGKKSKAVIDGKEKEKGKEEGGR